MEGEAEESELPKSISELIEEFQGVFELPAGLPPKRNVDHRIVLQEDQAPINVRPINTPMFKRTR